jgi:NIPSNAP
MHDLLARFEHHTIGLWKKHGIRQAGFWTTIIGPSEQQLTYMLAWESIGERQSRWKAFESDPDWKAIRAKIESNGQLIVNIQSSLLEPTAFSSVM